MALRLHVCAHHAKTHDGLSVLGQESRNDGVKGSLTWRHQIGWIVSIGIDVESMATVLQTHTKGRFYTSRTKAHVIALNKTDHHAVFISGT